MKILLVDDSQIDRHIVKRALRNNNEIKLIHEVGSAEEGLAVAQDVQFDIILLDYKMPTLDGIDMILELRARPSLGQTAIVMISALDDEALALSCLQAGAQDFLTKEEITASKLKRSIVQAQKRFELEKKLNDSFCQVRELAEKDSLTGLSNRYYFEEALKVSIDNNQRIKNNVALLMLDLDHFKNVNDSYGHDVGDQLLIDVTNRIKQCLRGNELFGRLGGDEFAILINNLTHIKETTSIVQCIHSSLATPFEINGHSIQCGVSIGIAMHPYNTDSAEILTKYADIAMYKAKKLGRNQFCFFEEEMQEQFSRKYKIEQALKESINNNNFQLNYQPVICAKNHNIVGVEALIRWPNCCFNSTPDEFIPIAEESRLIILLGEWIIETAVQQLSQWNKTYNNSLTMAINISAIQLGSSSFVTFIKNIFNKYKIPPKSIILEFTETALLNQDETSNQCITELYQLGCRLALDDFGTGFSSLSHLLNYPIDIVKLDKSLLPNSATEERHLSIVRGLAAMAHTIGLDIIAEGVETEYQSKLCNSLNIRELQGFFFDKALPASELEARWLEN